MRVCGHVYVVCVVGGESRGHEFRPASQCCNLDFDAIRKCLPCPPFLPVRLSAFPSARSIGHAQARPADAVPEPLETIPERPPTGERAPPTPLRKLDWVVWLQLSNTAFQVCLCSFMWALDRYDRPSWSTGLFVCLACIVGAVAGAVMGAEGKAVKKIEGVPLTKRDLARLARDRELGVPHHNNYGDKDPEVEAAKRRKKQQKRRWFGVRAAPSEKPAFSEV